jgi:hypothetical protein
MRTGTAAGQEITRIVDKAMSTNRNLRATGEVIADAFPSCRFWQECRWL